jgi:hypothetical protein
MAYKGSGGGKGHQTAADARAGNVGTGGKAPGHDRTAAPGSGSHGEAKEQGGGSMTVGGFGAMGSPSGVQPGAPVPPRSRPPGVPAVQPAAPTFPGALTPDFIKSALSKTFWGDQGAPLGPTSFGGGMAAAQQSPAGGPVLPPPVAQMAAGSPVASQPGPLPGVPTAPPPPGVPAPPGGPVAGGLQARPPAVPMRPGPGQGMPKQGYGVDPIRTQISQMAANRSPAPLGVPRPRGPMPAGAANPFLQQVGFQGGRQ